MTKFFNTGITQQVFLDQYWQKKPLVIRQAFPDFQSVISPDELAGLACESKIESRLIIEKGEADSWQLIDGPFSDKDFSALPESHWTLLVQDIDKHVPETKGILEPFSFIPNWRFEDPLGRILMVMMFFYYKGWERESGRRLLDHYMSQHC